MKILNHNNLLFTLLTLALISFTACVEDDDFDPPSSEITDPIFDEGTIFTTISAVAGALSQEQDDNDGIFDPQPLDYSNENVTFTYAFNEADLILEAYVVSSDEGGNYFEEIILQDEFENPTIGIKLLIDVNPLFIRYDVGRKLFVRLNGLTVGITNGVLTLGQADGNDVGKISPADEFEVIQRSSEKQDIVPLQLEISEFTEDKTNLFVQLQDVQFNRNQAGQVSYAAESSDQFDGERTLESCSESASVIFSTSTFADFGAATLASGRGTVNGVLTRNFEGEAFIIVVNTLEGVELDNPERCDPGEFIISTDGVDCDDVFPTGNITVFSDNFESYSNQGDLINAGWTVVNIGGGSYTWGIDDFSGNTFAIGNAFNTDEQDIDTWLISPEIDLGNTSDNVLNFDIQTNFNGGEVMSVYVSTDFNDINTDSNWSLFEDVTIPDGPSNGFGSFMEAGPVNLDCLSGTIRIGFRYTGSDPGITTRYHVDNVVVTGN